MQATTLRSFTTRLPLPGRVVRGIVARRAETLLFPTEPTVVTARGGRFEIRDYGEYIQRNIFFLGYHEFRETRLVCSVLERGQTFVDAGANLGWFTVLAARLVGDSGRVLSFEPSTRIRGHLTRNVELNGFSNVRIESCALGEASGTAVFSGGTEGNLGTGTITRPDAAGEAVDVRTLDDYCASQGIERIDFLKIDVEGAEGMVLRGARGLLAERRIARLLVEINDVRLRELGTSAREALELLRGSGYQLHRVGGFGLARIEPGDAVAEENIFAVAPDRA